MATRGEEVQTYGIDDILYGEGGGEVPGPGEGTELFANGGLKTGLMDIRWGGSPHLQQAMQLLNSLLINVVVHILFW